MVNFAQLRIAKLKEINWRRPGQDQKVVVLRVPAPRRIQSLA
jgi:hypothetical protein